MAKGFRSGFTLIELSIVLVIIGLIVGGILTGRNLIDAAGARAQITQIEKYNTAVRTFQGKYGYLPGDINVTAAAQFGFAARGQYAGEGDGNGIIEGIDANAPNSNWGLWTMGETDMVWVDLSAAHLIDSSFNTATSTTFAPGWPPSVATSYYPNASIGNINSIYVWSNGGVNYFGISVPTYYNQGQMFSYPALTVQQAYSMDKKVDDGLPQTGRVTTMYNNAYTNTNGPSWPAGAGGTVSGAAPGTAATGTSSTCYDNGSNASSPMAYSLAQNGGNGINCALSFQFQ